MRRCATGSPIFILLTTNRFKFEQTSERPLSLVSTGDGDMTNFLQTGLYLNDGKVRNRMLICLYYVASAMTSNVMPPSRSLDSLIFSLLLLL